MERGSNQCKRSLMGSNNSCCSSFRLRSPSLNSLRLRRIFDVFDKNQDGYITIDELSQALHKLGLEVDLSELESMVKSHIQLGNIGLRFEDFEALHRSLNETFFGAEDEDGLEEDDGEELSAEEEEEAKTCQEESDLSEAFKVFDEDGDGYISARELQDVLGKLGLPEGKEIDSVERMILSVDRNHDGLVDFFEFKEMMMRSVIVRTA
ncbi:hypothetical protein U1Q18_013993 [Sarracenia purpurea var. burkii]